MKRQIAKVIEANGNVRLASPINGKKFTSDELCSLIDCKCLERVPYESHNMWIDGEGMMKQRNAVATVLVAQHLMPGNYIAGTAVIVNNVKD